MKGLVVGLLLAFVTIHFWVPIFKRKNKIDLNLLYHSINRIRVIKQVHLTIGVIINILLFTFFTTKNLLNTYILIILGISFSIIVFIILRRIKLTSIVKYHAKYILAPSILNLFFTINFLFSSNPKIETYKFRSKLMDDPNFGFGYHEKRLIKSTYIILENNKYKNYIFLKFFKDIETLEHKNQIEYTIEKGLFGIKVEKSYNLK